MQIFASARLRIYILLKTARLHLVGLTSPFKPSAVCCSVPNMVNVANFANIVNIANIVTLFGFYFFHISSLISDGKIKKVSAQDCLDPLELLSPFKPPAVAFLTHCLFNRAQSL